MSEPLFTLIQHDAKGGLKSTPIGIDYLQEPQSVAKASYGNGWSRKFEDYEGNISVKSDYNRSDYEWFRTNTSNLSPQDMMKVSQKAYEKVGMIRSIIDMMGDFTCQGIRIEHPHPKKQRFLQEWFEYVRGNHTSERFANMFYRLGNVPIQAAYGIISTPNETKMSVSKGEFDTTEYLATKTNRREIPLKYTFIPPWEIQAVGGELGLFINKPYYAVKIPATLRSELNKVGTITNAKLKTEVEETLKKLQPYIDSGNKLIYLDPKNFFVYFYKKDDWQTWSLPIIAAVLDDLIMLERMKLADMSALDGAISNIRHWKVGILDPTNPTNSIIPTKAGINKVKTILANSVGGGTMDLVTGPEIEFKESNTQIHKFLGSEKYKTTLDAIYDGMGIPPPLRSASTSTNGTNNYISLKTLIEKLEYGRMALTSFWNKQLEIVQKALGHNKPGKVVFDNIILSDEATEKRLLVDLLDRDIISAEAVRHSFGYIPTLENVKVNREAKAREAKKMPPKASPYHAPEKQYEYKKVLLQNGDITPTEAGVELEERKEGEETRQEVVAKQNESKLAIMAAKPVGTQGRPGGSKDKIKRKKRPNFRPRTGKAYNNLVLWTNTAYAYISEKLSEVILNTFNKKNFRQLTTAEAQEAEDFKLNVFSQLEPMSELTEKTICLALETIETAKGSTIKDNYKVFMSDYVNTNNKEPSADEKRQLQILAYVEANFDIILESGV